MTPLRVMVLLSAARHPATGFACRAPADAAALELALRLPQARVTGVHVGAPDDPSLRDYLGMGLPEIRVWSGGGRGLAAALAAILAREAPDIILAGERAAAGGGGGLLPYALAEALDLPLVPEVQQISMAADGIVFVSAVGSLPRRVLLRGPAVATASARGVEARPILRRLARSGTVTACGDLGGRPAAALLRPRALRPRPLPPPPSGPAWTRIRGIIGPDAGATDRRAIAEPEAAAQALAGLFQEAGVWGTGVWGTDDTTDQHQQEGNHDRTP